MLVVGDAGSGSRREAGGRSRGAEALREAREARETARKRREIESRGERTVTTSDRSKAWAQTGIVGMREIGATAIDERVFALGSKVRVLDYGGNALTSIGAAEKVALLTEVSRIVLRDNALGSSGSMPWNALARASQSLTFLDLSGNPNLGASMTGFDSTIVFSSLRTLNLSRCGLTNACLVSFSFPTLRNACVAENALAEALPEFADSEHLEVLDASRNAITSIPPSFGAMHRKLHSLNLARNAVEAHGVPASFLADAEALVEFSLHDNPLSTAAFREIEGYESFDARRKTRASKALDAKVMLSKSVFDEGIDADRFERFT
ncbi:hypothetical protein BE221DRAFT_80520 [Ostreococcus tauri]|uniref:Leucine-rich repeat n=1 Tax=Ostreococcus tauri TaxID=70448 RepID=A0A1Y5I143_OSTTA|nr:hypothetical protein BE221DRAFT_80520 [Ostreococcus tauri]